MTDSNRKNRKKSFCFQVLFVLFISLLEMAIRPAAIEKSDGNIVLADTRLFAEASLYFIVLMLDDCDNWNDVVFFYHST
jgi:hypothetical protein